MSSFVFFFYGSSVVQLPQAFSHQVFRAMAEASVRFTLEEAEQLVKIQMDTVRGYQRQVQDHEQKMAIADQKLSIALQLLKTVKIESQQLQKQVEMVNSQTLSLEVHSSDLISRLHASELLQAEQASSHRSQLS